MRNDQEQGVRIQLLRVPFLILVTHLCLIYFRERNRTAQDSISEDKIWSLQDSASL